MAQKNQTIVNPIIGDKIKFLVTSEDSKGDILSVELWCKPGALGTPLHYHPNQTEKFEVIHGKLGVHDSGKDMVLTEGESYTIEKNSLHRFWNANENDEVLVKVDLKPALKTEYWLETIYSIAEQGKANEAGMPKNPLQMAAMLNEYYGELFLKNPPVIVQKFMAKVVGNIAKMIGFKGFVSMKNYS